MTSSRATERWIWIAAVMAMVLGCARQARRIDRVPLDQGIRDGDGRFSERADTVALDDAIRFYLSAHQRQPDDPRALDRLARAYFTRAYGFPETGAEGFSTAREYGLACLMTEPSFEGLVRAKGGIIEADALQHIERDRLGCLNWTTLAWSRWLLSRDVGGAGIDLEAVEAVARRAVQLSATYDRGRTQAALGLALALPLPPLAPDLDAAEAAFQRAIEAGPSRLTPSVDLAEMVYAVRKDDAQWRETLEAVINATLDPTDRDLLENRRAVSRARELLVAGPDRRWVESP